MQRSRLVGFIISIVIGLTIGLLYGWLVKPPEISNTSLSSLRSDYKADFVLMVAENYASDTDIEKAVNSLMEINPASPLAAVQQALLTGQTLGYSESDMRYMAALEMGIRERGGE